MLLENVGSGVGCSDVSTAAAVAETNPAGLLNGPSALTPSSGAANQTDAAISDLKMLMHAVAPVAGGGQIVFVCSPAQAFSIAARIEDPLYDVLPSGAIADGTIIAIATPTLVSIVDAPSIEESGVALAHVDSVPQQISVPDRRRSSRADAKLLSNRHGRIATETASEMGAAIAARHRIPDRSKLVTKEEQDRIVSEAFEAIARVEQMARRTPQENLEAEIARSAHHNPAVRAERRRAAELDEPEPEVMFSEPTATPPAPAIEQPPVIAEDYLHELIAAVIADVQHEYDQKLDKLQPKEVTRA